MRRLRPCRLGLLGVMLFLAAGAGAAFGAGAAEARTSPRAALSASLGRLFAAAGGGGGGLVRDLSTGRTLYSRKPDIRRLPASVEKIYTTSTSLARMGADGTLTTRILGVGQVSGGVWSGTLYLRGGGDPTFGSASYDRYAYGTGATIQTLVANLIEQYGITAVSGRVIGDESYFDGNRGTPATGNALSADVEGELSGLAFDRGFADEQGSAFQAWPPLFAAQQLASALRTRGVTLLPGLRVGAGRTPDTAVPLASVSSPKLATIAELTNSPSDNYLAEMLLKGLGARYGSAGSTLAGASVVRAQLAASFGIHPALDDGSGLSRDDRTSPRDVVTALTGLASNPAFVDSLSIAGVRGTMQSGLARTSAARRCQGKTGTLHDVANLVGYCTAADHHRLVFAFMLNSVTNPAAGHADEDRMAVSVARYSG
ncbi:MAG TPA: D-alanyl-D-alanine carboxypeptidase [Solirubrobacteraceae bacterium]|nr:D-alanyl-D-alanine carboxypeptidase [Solirubrobacteraceae bacterium]